MKTKDKDRHDGRSVKSNEDERSPNADQRGSNEPTDKRQKTSADKDVETSLSKGYFPDGPGGNYRGM